MSKRLALIIGNSLYRDKTLSRLTAPDADVGAFQDALLDPGLGGFDDVKLIFNSASHVVRKEIFNFFAGKDRTDLLLFYFSGHGVLDENGRLYLAVKDTDSKALRGTALPARYITDEMDNSRSRRQVLILDCCHSGAFERGTKGVPGMRVGTGNTFEGSGFGRVVLTASDATQYAWEGNTVIGEAENSLFTHFLIKGMQSGEADVNQDGKITVDELYDYVFSQILKETPKQTPGKWSFKEQGELIISHAPPRQIAEETLSSIEEQQLQRLYAEGLSALYAEEWDDAIDKLKQVIEIQPGYSNASDKLKEALEQKQRKELYLQAVLDFDSGRLEEAKAKLLQIRQAQRGYKNTDKLLERVNASLRKAQPAPPIQQEEPAVEKKAKTDEPMPPPAHTEREQPARAKTGQVDWKQWFDFLRDTSKWRIGKRELIAGAIGAVVFGVLSWIGEARLNTAFIFFPSPTVPAFFGIAFGPIAGLMSGGLGFLIMAFIIEGHLHFDLIGFSNVVFMGLLPGLLYPLKDFRSPQNILKSIGLAILGYSFSFRLGEGLNRLIYGEWGLSFIDWFKYEFWKVSLIIAVALPILMIAYDAIVRRRNQS